MAKKQTKKVKPKARRKLTVKRRRSADGFLEMDDVLRKVNFVQVERKTAKFAVSSNDAPVVRNVLRDAGVVVEEAEQTNGVHFTVTPGAPPELDEGELDELDEMSDEVAEDGQVFE